MIGLEVELFHGRRRVARKRVARIGALGHRVLLRVRGHAPVDGRYALVVRKDHATLVRHPVRVD